MGRRSINTTKSGKYMNPTDQARKEARKRELKKNKKQRQMVRAAVLKGKDPFQLITELEKIDRMECSVEAPPPLNEKVLKDKRKKLKETWDRVMKLYYKEDPEKWSELKKLEVEYERKRNLLVKYYESVKFAQQVQVEEIPLPNAPDTPYTGAGVSQIPLPSDIPLPDQMHQTSMQLPFHPQLIPQPPSILKKISVYDMKGEGAFDPRKTPGVPQGPPPDWSDDDDEVEEPIDDDSDEEEERLMRKKKKLRFADDFEDDDDDDGKKDSDATLLPPGVPQIPLPGSAPMPFRPPPLRPGLPPPSRLVPPGMPPPGRPPGPPPGPPPSLLHNIRLPPGPPPGMPPPRMMRPPMMPPGVPPPPGVNPNSGMMSQHVPIRLTIAGNPNVVSAPPSIQKPKQGQLGDKKSSATIEAKPQIRNLSADLMRFTPTTLRVKREDKVKKPSTGHQDIGKDLSSLGKATSVSGTTKDDVYEQFMKEMNILL